MSTSNEAALAYREPPIVDILVQSSFLLLSNVLNWALDALLYCGLVGQILVGVAWGTPGGRILSPDVERAVVQLGYVGLILLVFEGGLCTSFPSLKANMALSTCVAATGIGAPIGLSFVLARLADAPPLQCFAAGAALCSTSLGTTFAVLRASGLAPTRFGVVLTSAAMLDDVVGLVMVQVVSDLGASSSEGVSAVTVVRPVLVSAAVVVAAAVLCRYVVRPATDIANRWRTTARGGELDKLLRREATALVVHTALLVASVAAASYAGTSNLLASYVAGAAISWWDSEVLPHLDEASRGGGGEAEAETEVDTTAGSDRAVAPRDGAGTSARPAVDSSYVSGSDVFAHYYYPALKWVLQPFFFASIGFSIPVTRMFSGAVVWKGIVYAL